MFQKPEPKATPLIVQEEGQGQNEDTTDTTQSSPPSSSLYKKDYKYNSYHLPKWIHDKISQITNHPYALQISIPIFGILGLVGLAYLLSPSVPSNVTIAHIGNSIQYYNDMPRLLETLAGGKITKQNSCLHGGADLTTIIQHGNGMFYKWSTSNAQINQGNSEHYDADHPIIYDYGACTVPQLMLGKDEQLDKMMGYDDDEDNNEDDNNNNNGRRKLQRQRQRQRQRRRRQEDENEEEEEEGEGDDAVDDYDYDDNNNNEDVDGNDYEYYHYYGDDEYEPYALEDDGTNPCLNNEDYYLYLESLYEKNGPPKWDYVVINDNTRNPCCTDQRQESMEILQDYYVPLLQRTKAKPILLDTYGYWANTTRDMSGLIDMPTFQSYTYTGYEAYTDLLASMLPRSQRPVIAPVGLAMLLIYEEEPYEFWEQLMHYDEIHLSPSGTLLEAIILHATIFGELPDTNVVFHIVNGENAVADLWHNARKMVPEKDGMKPLPDVNMVKYLYHIAHRICILGEIPKTLNIQYNVDEIGDRNGQQRYYKSIDFIPEDPQ